MRLSQIWIDSNWRWPSYTHSRVLWAWCNDDCRHTETAMLACELQFKMPIMSACTSCIIHSACSYDASCHLLRVIRLKIFGDMRPVPVSMIKCFKQVMNTILHTNMTSCHIPSHELVSLVYPFCVTIKPDVDRLRSGFSSCCCARRPFLMLSCLHVLFGGSCLAMLPHEECFPVAMMLGALQL